LLFSCDEVDRNRISGKRNRGKFKSRLKFSSSGSLGLHLHAILAAFAALAAAVKLMQR
jgi:hypothetical protein